MFTTTAQRKEINCIYLNSRLVTRFVHAAIQINMPTIFSERMHVQTS